MVVLSILSVVFVVAFAYSLRVSGQIYAASHMMMATRANYLAEGGARCAIQHVGDWAVPYDRTLAFESGTVLVHGQGQGGDVVISSQCQQGDVTKKIQVVCSKSGAIEAWSEFTL